jgi:DNA end-binding protein Ku
MARVAWRGAIAFGLVHVPVALYPASQEGGIDFDWLDKRTMDPVGYKRINKRTGKEIESDDIVRGLKAPGAKDGAYVLLGDDEIKAAYPVSTQTIEIEAFVKAEEISFVLLEKPYFLAPSEKAGKVYALLREAMLAEGVIGVARFVMHAKEHLAILVADHELLFLNTIRWASELRDRKDIESPPAGRGALKDAEIEMATQLVAGMTERFDLSRYEDRFPAAIHALAAKRVAAGDTEEIAPFEEARAAESNVVDLTELLRNSLKQKPAPAAPKAAKKTAPTSARGRSASPSRARRGRRPPPAGGARRGR